MSWKPIFRGNAIEQPTIPFQDNGYVLVLIVALRPSRRAAAKRRRLNERTAQEIQIYERTRRELEKETSEEVWEQKNDALRRLGLRTIPHPGEERLLKRFKG